MQNTSDPGFSIPDPNLLQIESPASAESGTQEAAGTDITSILERHRDALMKVEGVVMVGEGQDEIGQPAILVGVKQRHQLRAVPKELESVPVVGMVIGEVDALGKGRRGR